MRSREFILTVAILSFFPSAGLTDNQISEEQAIHQLTTWIKSNRYYDFPPDCLRPKSLGYKNAGYTIELAAEGCPGNTPVGVVARWRVDAKTAEIYVQNGEGRYVPPQPENQAISHPVVREEHTVIVDSVRERWLLVWREPPKPICSAETGDALPPGGTCVGFRYGEYGQLDLVRKRPGAPNDLLPLGPLYGESAAGEGMAVMPHWPYMDGDYELSQ